MGPGFHRFSVVDLLDKIHWNTSVPKLLRNFSQKSSKKLQTRGHAACSYSETTRLDPALDPNRHSSMYQQPPWFSQQLAYIEATSCAERIHIPSANGKKTECTVAFFHDSSDGLVLNRCSSIDNLWLWVHEVCLHALHPSTYLSCCHCHPGHANVWPGIAATNVCKSSQRHDTKRTTPFRRNSMCYSRCCKNMQTLYYKFSIDILSTHVTVGIYSTMAVVAVALFAPLSRIKGKWRRVID